MGKSGYELSIQALQFAAPKQQVTVVIDPFTNLVFASKCLRLILQKGFAVMEWLKQKPDTLTYHLQHPGIDTNQYLQAKRLDLGRKIASRHRIYLDTKQWLQMRDVLMGRPRNDAQQEIFSRLQLLQSQGKIICPISYSVFVELMSQADLTTRLATARIIDRLAEGTCCQQPFVLTERELMYFMIAKGGGPEQPPILHTVWTNVTHVIGEKVPHSSAFPPDIMSAMQRSYDDLLSEITLEEMITQLASAQWHDDSKEQELLVATLEEGKRKHAGDHNNFHDLLCEEICGGLDALLDILEKVMVDYSRARGWKGSIPEEQKTDGGRMLANLIAAAFRLRKITTELPQIHIHAALHAALRWDKKRKYDSNDFEDLRHACVAIPYYDVFCTERSLRHLLTQKALAFDTVYGTKVIATDEEFLSHLVAIAA